MASKPKEEIKVKEIPEVLLDPSTERKYLRGRFLGKGGFAKCYELTEVISKKVYAGKIVSKLLLTKQHQKEKMTQEIHIHRNIEHKHVVGFHSFFEDDDNVYIVLEICRKRSMMEMHKRRKAISEPETRYFLRQLLLAVKFLHDNNIIHRDLKLGNLFLNDEMELKLGDFGLATTLEYNGERKKTLCGTPNYIAPEVLAKKGHSFEVDIWSIGCIMYTLLVGKPPFETQTLKETYHRIKQNDYNIPPRMGASAKSLITKMLQSDPHKRPTVDKVLIDDFMTEGYMPTRLPTSCLTTAPRFDTKMSTSIIVTPSQRKPLLELNAKADAGSPLRNKDFNLLGPGVKASPVKNAHPAKIQEPTDSYLRDLHKQLGVLIASKPAERDVICEEETEDPAALPFVWVSKWVDYSDKYGFGYQLFDDSIGVIFNDLTKLLLLSNGKDIHYIERDSTENYHNVNQYPQSLEKKVKLLMYFQRYMNDHLLKAGATMAAREGDELSRIPSLRTWFRTSRAIVLYLTNGTLQVNFFKDHSKIILCPLMGAVTYIDDKKNSRTMRFSLIEQFGCRGELASRIQYAYDKIDTLLNAKSSSLRCKVSK